MSLFRNINNTVALCQEAGAVKNTRKAIFEMRDRLRGTSQFSNLFYSIITDVNHPPRMIEATQRGNFWSEAWEGNNYEPFSTHKFDNHNVGYYEGCALYLLIQECYPNVYDFPNNKLADVQNGATIKLIMKKPFIGKAIKPAIVPARAAEPQPQMVQTQAMQPQIAQPQASVRFCTQCGSQCQASAKFCQGCGSPIA